jgi:sulfotransferase
MKRRFAFLSGLPRSGSTVLSSLLSQHPLFHTTRTSIVRDLARHIYTYRLGESPFFDTKDPSSEAWGAMRGLLEGVYSQVKEEKIVLEKDREWPSDIQWLSQIIAEKPRIIATIRPIPEIVSSFILLSRQIGANNKIDEEVLSLGKELNDMNRANIIWEKYIFSSWAAFKAGYEYDPSCFFLVMYDDLVENPQKVIDGICAFLQVQPYIVKTEELRNPDPENDSIYGLPGLHNIRSKLSKISPPAEAVLGKDLYDLWMGKTLEMGKGGSIYLP